MKLLFIATSRIPTERAMGTAIMKQCEAFAYAGVEVELVVPSRHNERTENPFTYHSVEQNFSIHYLWAIDLQLLEKIKLRFFLQRITFFASLCLYIAKSNADILYSREPNILGVIQTRKRKFVELHHLYGLGFFGKRLLESFTGIITITHALKEDVMRLFGIPDSVILVAPSGVDLSKFTHATSREDARIQLGIETEKPVVMYIGSFEEWKGYKIFLAASEFFNESALFVAVGGSDDQVVILRRQYPAVQFLGFVPQKVLATCQQAANVFVAPNSGKELISARHTSPLKIFEYMVSGVPIVASSVPSIREVLSTRNAILVEPDNPEALAGGIKIAIENAPHSATIAEQARENVVKYDWNSRTDSILSFLNAP